MGDALLRLTQLTIAGIPSIPRRGQGRLATLQQPIPPQRPRKQRWTSSGWSPGRAPSLQRLPRDNRVPAGRGARLRWSDLDLTVGAAAIRQQVIPLPKSGGVGREGRIVAGTKSGDARVIELDTRTVAMRKAWRKEQARERLALGSGHRDHGLVFPRFDGRPFHPEAFSKTFDRRVRQEAFADLPTIRLHDLRHTWATLALEAGVEVAIVSERLGHSSPVITWGTYQHVRKGMQTDAAELVADAIFGAS